MLIALGSLLIPMPQAQAAHGTCRESVGGGNDFNLTGRGARAVAKATGVGGRFDVRTAALEAGGGLKVESFYLVVDRGMFLEFGWSVDRATIFTGPKTIFKARSYLGEYRSNDIETGDHLVGPQYVAMFRVPSENRYRFSRNGATYASNVRYQPPFRGGIPLAVSETFNECDDGSSRFWSLDYRHQNDTNTWFDWSLTRWTCDHYPH